MKNTFYFIEKVFPSGDVHIFVIPSCSLFTILPAIVQEGDQR